MICIEKNSVVTLRYTMKNSRGEVVENTIHGAPVHYLHGASGIHPLLQAQLDGLQAGESKQVHLQKENGLADAFTFDVIVEKVRQATPEEVQQGYPVVLNSTPCNADCACHDWQKPPTG